MSIRTRAGISAAAAFAVAAATTLTVIRIRSAVPPQKPAAAQPAPTPNLSLDKPAEPGKTRAYRVWRTRLSERFDSAWAAVSSSPIDLASTMIVVMIFGICLSVVAAIGFAFLDQQR